MSDRQPSAPSMTVPPADEPLAAVPVEAASLEAAPLEAAPLGAAPPEAAPAAGQPERRPRRWRKHPLTRLSEAIASAFFFALTVLPVYAVIVDGKNLIWLAYAVVAAAGCYLCIADAVRQETRSPSDEEEADRRFEAIIKNLDRE